MKGWKYVFAVVGITASIASTYGRQDNELLDSLATQARKYYAIDLDSSIHFTNLILTKSAQTANHHEHAFALNWKGICYMRMGAADSAETYFSRTIDYGNLHNDKEYVLKARLNRAINQFQQGNFEQSATLCYEALNDFEQQKDTLGIAHAKYNLANCFYRLDDPNKALQLYQEASAIYQTHGRAIEIANAFNALGSVHNDFNQLDSANNYFRKAVKTKVEAGGAHLCGSEYSNLGTNFETLQFPDSALRYYHLAHQAYQTIGDQRGVTLALSNLAFFWLQQEQADSSYLYATQALELNAQTDDQHMRYEIHRRIALAAHALGNDSAAFRHFAHYEALKDSLNGLEVKTTIADLELKYQTAQKDKALAEKNAIIAAQTAEASKKDFHTLLIVSIGILITLSLLFLVRRTQWKKRQLQQKAKLEMEQERSRIAMDLHDHLGAELTLISSKLDTRIYKSEREQERNDLSAISDQIREANDRLRETVWSVRYEEMTLEQLLARIRSFATKMLTDSNTKFQVQSEVDNMLLSAHQTLTLYRILQEGIHNALKHADAEALVLTISEEGNNLELALHDNGSGFDATQATSGYGLQNMKKRANDLEGSFELTSNTEGTALHIRIPITKS